MNAAVKATEKDAHGTTDNAQSSLLGQDASAGQESGKQPSDAPSDRGRTESVDAGKKRVAPKPKPKPASKAKPKPEVAPAKPVARSDPSLPPALAGAKPSFNYGPKRFSLTFASDIDRAAYITARENPSKRDAAYCKFVAAATGVHTDTGPPAGHRPQPQNKNT